MRHPSLLSVDVPPRGDLKTLRLEKEAALKVFYFLDSFSEILE
jgi:hypothetical protein